MSKLYSHKATTLVLSLFLLFLSLTPELFAYGIAKPKTEGNNHPKALSIRGRSVVFRTSNQLLKRVKPSSDEISLSTEHQDFDLASESVHEIDIYNETPEIALSEEELDLLEYCDGDILYEPIQFDNSELIAKTQKLERENYRLKVGDTFLISIYGEENTEREVVVDPRGMISYLFVDSIIAIGKTIAEIREEITQSLRSYYRFVTLAITPIKFSAEFYIVTGHVQESGKQPLIGRPTLLSALCQAQGFAVIEYRDQLFDMCDLEKAFLARNGEYIPIDFNQLVKHGDLQQDVALEAGDFIHVPNRTVNQVFVVGEVFAPLSIEYYNDISLVEAIAEAGDVTERASSRVLVLRGSLSCPVRYLVDYSRVVKGCYPNFQLQPGDIVFVPPRKLYLLKEIFRLAVASFISTVAYETGIDWFIRTHPHAEGDLGGSAFVPGGVIIP